MLQLNRSLFFLSILKLLVLLRREISQLVGKWREWPHHQFFVFDNFSQVCLSFVPLGSILSGCKKGFKRVKPGETCQLIFQREFKGRSGLFRLANRNTQCRNPLPVGRPYCLPWLYFNGVMLCCYIVLFRLFKTAEEQDELAFAKIYISCMPESEVKKDPKEKSS